MPVDFGTLTQFLFFCSRASFPRVAFIPIVCTTTAIITTMGLVSTGLHVFRKRLAIYSYGSNDAAVQHLSKIRKCHDLIFFQRIPQIFTYTLRLQGRSRPRCCYTVCLWRYYIQDKVKNQLTVKNFHLYLLS